jgi:hypothetical protein
MTLREIIHDVIRQAQEPEVTTRDLPLIAFRGSEPFKTPQPGPERRLQILRKPPFSCKLEAYSAPYTKVTSRGNLT